MRILVAWATCGAVVLSGLTGCSGSSHSGRTYGAQSARTGESLAVLGWNMSVSNLRWSGDYVLIDVDASPTDPHAPHAKPEDIRFGLYGALAHEATAVTPHVIGLPRGGVRRSRGRT